jgi:hypothetical protein
MDVVVAYVDVKDLANSKIAFAEIVISRVGRDKIFSLTML